MNDNQWFIIDDLDQFVESSRVLIFDNFGKKESNNSDELSMILSDLSSDEVDELNQILSQSECMAIAKQFIRVEQNRKTKDVRYVIDTKQYMSMLESFNSRMVSNLLSDLVSKGILDSAYDSESNDFVFWVKDDNKEKEAPETD